jgi:hypothetical protein
MSDSSVSLPLDNDGFLRRECPHCEQEFKWHHGPANEEAESQPPFETYFCPRCGQPAGPDSWWTQDQLHIIEAAQSAVVNQVLGDAFKGFRNSKHVKVSLEGFDTPDKMPEPLVEPDDMEIVTSPCHAWEPVKVPDSAPGPLYCLVCGSAFAL